jgi:hypothetical protein
MSLKLLLVLFALVLSGVVASVHGYVSAERQLHPQQVCPMAESADACADDDGVLDYCTEECEAVEAGLPQEFQRVQRRFAMHLRTPVACAPEMAEVAPITSSDS